MESDFDKNCTSYFSPKTVLHQRQLDSANTSSSKPSRKDDILRVRDGFTEISFRRYRSASCKNAPSRRSGLESIVELKRGSVYQTSREVSRLKKMTGIPQGREKIEISHGSDTSSHLNILSAICSSDERKQMTSSSKHHMSIRKSCLEFVSSDDFIEICPNLEGRGKQCSHTVRSSWIENHDSRCKQLVAPQTDGNELLERDLAVLKREQVIPSQTHSDKLLQGDEDALKSEHVVPSQICSSKQLEREQAMKLEIPQSPSSSEIDCSTESSSKYRMRKIFDPFIKSKSLPSPSGNRHDPHKPPLPFEKSDTNMVRSPVHLHGCLKLEDKYDSPCFEFSLDSPEEAFVAKTWKAGNGSKWVYTLHSICNRKKSSVSSRSSSDQNKESSVVGQMQVSCNLSSERKEGGVFHNVMVTEFVLYDLARARQSISTQDSSYIVKNGCIHLKNQQIPSRHTFDSRSSESLNQCPLPSSVLQPELELAAIIIQVPVAKSSSSLCKIDQREKHLPGKLNVVIPSGNHSSASEKSRDPSSLLDKWRSGGGCDCGGWDMACPLTVFGNPSTRGVEDETLIGTHRPLHLFVLGAEEKIPSFTMRVVGEGHYGIDFHARLSTLQAFSICIAALHGAEVSSAASVEGRSNQTVPRSNPLKVFIEEEVKFLIEAVTDAEKNMKKKTMKKKKGGQQPYVLNPPFSPIARV